MNCWYEGRRRMKENQSARKSEIGVPGAQHRNVCAGDLRLFADVDRRSASGIHVGGVARVGQKSYLAHFGLIESGGAFYFDICVARVATGAGLGREFGESHGREFSAFVWIRARVYARDAEFAVG